MSMPFDALDARTPASGVPDMWETFKADARLVAPANRRRFHVLVIGTGLAGASAAATLGEAGYQVTAVTYHDSPRRAHSVAAQGGINAAKNYRADGDSVTRLFNDTIKGGDFRSREANVWRLAEVSSSIIDQAASQGVPFAREYGGTLDTRSFGGTQVARTFYARGQTGQQLLLGAYQAMMRQVAAGTVKLLTRTEFMATVILDGECRGAVLRHLLTGELTTVTADAVVLATGGYSNVFYLSTNARLSNASAVWRAHQSGAAFANPSFTQIHPTCLPPSGHEQSKLTLMSESLRNDGRIWVPHTTGDLRSPSEIASTERDYFLERLYPSFGNLSPRDIASRAAKRMVDAGHGVGPLANGVYLDFADAITRLGRDVIDARYGNLFEMYAKLTGEDPWSAPMRIYPAPHYTMGGLWVDYHLQTTIPGLFAIGEANFSDHGANRLGASALMQGLADGYFVLPATLADYLSRRLATASDINDGDSRLRAAADTVADRVTRFRDSGGNTHPNVFHRQLGNILWNACGMERSAEGLRNAISSISALWDEYRSEVGVPAGTGQNQTLETALRVDDFFGLALLMCRDALAREESCGAHFRTEYQTADGEAARNDEQFAHVAVWSGTDPHDAARTTEALTFTVSTPSTRSYR